MDTKPLQLEPGQSQRLEVTQDGEAIGEVGRWAHDRGRVWYWKTPNGGYGQAASKRDTCSAVLEIHQRNKV